MGCQHTADRSCAVCAKNTARTARLIKDAEKFANKEAGAQPKKAADVRTAKEEEAHAAWCNKWNQAFHGEMDRLARRAGLREQAYQAGF